MEKPVYLYLLVMAGMTFLVRSLPLTLLRSRIRNTFIQSFLFYVPYVTLSVMTFPAILHATGSALSGLLALAVGVVSAWYGSGLFRVALFCCAAVLLSEIVLL